MAKAKNPIRKKKQKKNSFCNYAPLAPYPFVALSLLLRYSLQFYGYHYTNAIKIKIPLFLATKHNYHKLRV